MKKLRTPLRLVEALLDATASFIRKLFIALIIAFVAVVVVGTSLVIVITKIAT